MKQYVSRRYLLEKWENLKWAMEDVIGVDKDGDDNVAEATAKVAWDVCGLMESIKREIGGAQ